MIHDQVQPFLRWAGGKRWLSSRLSHVLRIVLKGKYIEPFVGSGAVFFSLAPQKAILSDLNSDLMNAYQQVRKNYKELLKRIKRIPVNEEMYYKIRELKPTSFTERAVRFIYLNRTCYGGIYRENQQGQFNTPYGGGCRTPSLLWEQDLLAPISKILNKSNIQLNTCDFERSIEKAENGDVIYCDPTYHPFKGQHFNRYGSTIFGWDDQIRLAKAARRAIDRGAVFVVSNTFCSDIKMLYRGAFRICLKKQKTIGKVCKTPEQQFEYLIILDPYERRDVWTTLGCIEEDKEPLRQLAIDIHLDTLSPSYHQNLLPMGAIAAH
jgi:DNA adenine methylase